MTTQDGKVAVRNIRRESVDKIKAAEKDKDIGKDDSKGFQVCSCFLLLLLLTPVLIYLLTPFLTFLHLLLLPHVLTYSCSYFRSSQCTCIHMSAYVT